MSVIFVGMFAGVVGLFWLLALWLVGFIVLKGTSEERFAISLTNIMVFLGAVLALCVMYLYNNG